MDLNYLLYAYMSGDWVSSSGRELEQVPAVQIFWKKTFKHTGNN